MAQAGQGSVTGRPGQKARRARLQAIGMPYCAHRCRQQPRCQLGGTACLNSGSAPCRSTRQADDRGVRLQCLTEVVSAMVERATKAEKATVDCAWAGAECCLHSCQCAAQSRQRAHLEQGQPHHGGHQH